MAYVQNQYIAPVYELINSLTPLIKNVEINKPLEKDLLESFYKTLDNCPPALLGNSLVTYYLQKELFPLFLTLTTQSDPTKDNSQNNIGCEFFANKLLYRNHNIYFAKKLLNKNSFTENELKLCGKLVNDFYWSYFDIYEYNRLFEKYKGCTSCDNESLVITYYENIIAAFAKQWGEQKILGIKYIYDFYKNPFLSILLPKQTKSWSAIFKALNTAIPSLKNTIFSDALGTLFLNIDEFFKIPEKERGESLQELRAFLDGCIPRRKENYQLEIKDSKVYKDITDCKNDEERLKLWQDLGNLDKKLHEIKDLLNAKESTLPPRWDVVTDLDWDGETNPFEDPYLSLIVKD